MSSGKGPEQERRWVPPASFDGYRLLRPLGAGGMGFVYLGHDLLLDRPVAIKFIAGPAPDHRRRERFLFEGRALARLIHPNVVLTFRVGDVEGRPFMVSEYVSGRPLDQLERAMPWRRVLEIGIGLARGLAAAHRAGVLHRDVKPANVVLTDDGTVKLIDFGLAKLVGDDDVPAAAVAVAAMPPASMAATESDGDGDAGLEPGDVSEAGEADEAGSSVTASLASASAPGPGGAVATYPPASPDLSRPGTVVGTRRYMAPERLAGQPATRRSDTYSLGCVLHELCWGASPGEPPSASSVPVAPEFQAILERCLAHDPADRFASVDAALEALETLADDTSASGEVPAGNPYRGLEAFDAPHRAVFLGRSAEVLAIVERLRADPVVVIAGDSGAGKSSLCKAGVLPWIAESGLAPGRAAVALAAVPGRDPVARLAEALADFLAEPAAALRARLADEPTEVLRQLARAAGERTIVLFVDQIEELFTLAPAAEAAIAARALAVLCSGRPLRVLATVRGDFLARLAALPELGPEVARAPYLLRPLGPDKLREVIVGPARRTGASFEDPGTVDALLRASLSSEGSLPLLSFTLAELWDARDPHTGVIPAGALARLGGMDGALERHADRVIGALPAEQRDAARRLLVRLVTGQRTRAALEKDELARSPGDEAALEALVAGRIAVVRGAAHGAIVELAHEALIARWSQLRRWLDDEAEDARHRERLAAAAGDWDRLGRAGDGLWRRRQLAGAGALDAALLAPRERDFLAASRAAARRARLFAVAVPVGAVAAVGLAIGLAITGARMRAQSEIAAAVDRRLAEARARATEAHRLDAESAELHADALRRFDRGAGLAPSAGPDGDVEHSWEQAERAWARVLSVSDAAAAAYARASSAFEAALFIDPSRHEVRDELAYVLAARLAFAERMRQRDAAGELAERLAALIAAGAAPALRTADRTSLTVHRAPPEAAVALARFEPDATGHLVLGPSAPLGAGPLAPGSYLLTGSAPGRATVRVPVLLARGGHAQVEVSLPPEGAIPPGFVLVPAGESLIGSDEENIRVGLGVSPLHAVRVDSFLIGRFEVTFADYIGWLDTLPDAERRRRSPSSPSSPGAVELVRAADHRWTLMLAPTTTRYIAAWGEPIRYPGRMLRALAELVHPGRRALAVHDWRRFPVTGISFEDAAAYSAWLAGTLPGAHVCREEEWERAGRGADARIYTVGRQLAPSEANFDVSYGARDLAFGPDEVGSHPESASVFGVEDLQGNADELVASGRWGEANAQRGGSWYREAFQQRLDNRFRSVPTTRSVETGFRVCAPFSFK